MILCDLGVAQSSSTDRALGDTVILSSLLLLQIHRFISLRHVCGVVRKPARLRVCCLSAWKEEILSWRSWTLSSRSEEELLPSHLLHQRLVRQRNGRIYQTSPRKTSEHERLQHYSFDSMSDFCPVLQRNTALPLNGFSQEKELENISRTERPDEDWPDWEDAGEQTGKHQPVQISIQPADGDSELPTAVAYDEEGPWDDFEDSEVISERSTSTPQPVPSSKSISLGGAGPASVPTPEPARESKALKLGTASVKSASEQKCVSSPTGWEQNMKDNKPSKPDVATAAKPRNGHRSAGGGGLGEEFTIEVKKKPARDPELDLFADMVPDINLSSPSMFLPIVSSDSKPAGLPAVTVSHPEPDTTHFNTLELTAKFAAVDLTEVRLASF